MPWMRNALFKRLKRKIKDIKKALENGKKYIKNIEIKHSGLIKKLKTIIMEIY